MTYPPEGRRPFNGAMLVIIIQEISLASSLIKNYLQSRSWTHKPDIQSTLQISADVFPTSYSTISPMNPSLWLGTYSLPENISSLYLFKQYFCRTVLSLIKSCYEVMEGLATSFHGINLTPWMTSLYFWVCAISLAHSIYITVDVTGLVNVNTTED